MVDHVKRISAAVCMLLVTLAAALAQDDIRTRAGGWTSYLGVAEQSDALEAVEAVESGLKLRRESSPVVISSLLELHVAGRRERWPESEYRLALEEVSADDAARAERSSLEQIQSALETLTGVLRTNPPASGTSAARAVERWLLAINREQTVPVADVEQLVLEIELAGQNSASSAARAFVESLDMPIPDGFAGASAQDQLMQLVGQWWLIFLASPDDRARLGLLQELGDASASLTPEAHDAVRERAASWQERLVTVNAIDRVADQALSLLTAEGLAEAIAVTVSREQADNPAPESGRDRNESEALFDFIRIIARSSRDELLTAATLSSRTHVAVRIAERLLIALTDYHATKLAVLSGILPAGLREATHRLYRVRLDLASLQHSRAIQEAGAAAARYRATGDYDAESQLLDAYVSDARIFAEGLEPWIAGDEEREGDSYRWAMLSVLSNRRAQQMILNDRERSEEQRLLGEFVTSLYSGMMGRLDPEIAARLVRNPASDTADSYDRTYELSGPGVSGPEVEADAAGDVASESEVAAEAVYKAFVAEAQGQGLIGDLFASAATGLTASSDWAHTHGLHVARETGESPEIWFDLADRSENELQGFAHTLRGMLHLGGMIENRLEPPLRAALRPDLRLHDVRLDVALRHLSLVRSFDSTPGEALTVFYALFPESGSIAELFDAILLSTEAVATELEEVEVADRRSLGFNLGAP